MRIEDLGYFRELPHGDAAGPSLRETAGKGDIAVRDRVADYLASGSVLAVTAQQMVDVLSEEQIVIGWLAIQTDGRWTWPADLSYYVRTYNIGLPAEFVDGARSHDWTVRPLSRDDLIDVERRLTGGR